jgi:hypothetical protein
MLVIFCPPSLHPSTHAANGRRKLARMPQKLNENGPFDDPSPPTICILSREERDGRRRGVMRLLRVFRFRREETVRVTKMVLRKVRNPQSPPNPLNQASRLPLCFPRKMDNPALIRYTVRKRSTQ